MPKMRGKDLKNRQLLSQMRSKAQIGRHTRRSRQAHSPNRATLPNTRLPNMPHIPRIHPKNTRIPNTLTNPSNTNRLHNPLHPSRDSRNTQQDTKDITSSRRHSLCLGVRTDVKPLIRLFSLPSSISQSYIWLLSRCQFGVLVEYELRGV
jgi:hypothetical protein